MRAWIETLETRRLLSEAYGNFDYHHAPHTLVWELTDVPENFDGTSHILRNLTTGWQHQSSGFQWYAGGPPHAVFSAGANILSDGNYRSDLGLEGVDPLDFYFLQADLNYDRTVDELDEGIVYQHLNDQQFHYRSEGDVNYDGVVDNDDLAIITASFNTYLPEIPAAPGKLTATAALGRGRIDLNWLPPAIGPYNEPTGFRIFDSADGVNFTLRDTRYEPNLRHWIDGGIPDGTKRYYRVQAFNSGGSTELTNVASATTTLPGPGDFSAAVVSATKVNLNWSDNTDNESGYEIWQSTAGGAYTLIATLAAEPGEGPMTHQVTVQPNTSYRFRVRAVTAAQKSIFTPAASVSTGPDTYAISIANASFEDPVLSDGAWSTSVPNWTYATNATVTEWGRTLNPTSSQFSPQAPDGFNVAHLRLAPDNYNQFYYSELTQTLTETLVPDTTYVLSAKVGAAADWAWDAALIELRAAGSFLAGASTGFIGGLGQWETLQLTYTSPASGSLIGQPLQVRLRVVADFVVFGGGEAAFDDVKLTATLPPPTQTPRGGTLWAVPGVIEFEDYDDGGEGVAYHDINTGNIGGNYRRGEDADVDIARDDTGGYCIGWAKAGEWLEYTIDFGAGGVLDLTAFVSSPSNPNLEDLGAFHWELDGVDISGPTTVPATGGYYKYEPIVLSGYSFPAGVHVLRLALDDNGSDGIGWNSVGNFNYFTLTQPNPTLSAPSAPTADAPYPTRIDLTWTDSNINETEFVLQRRESGGSWTTIARPRANATFYADDDLTPGTSYEYQLAALNGAVQSGWATFSATTPTDMTGLPIKINFQVDGTRPLPGYLVDSGDEYDARPSGFAYGWNLDHRNMDRQRGLNSDPRLDSLLHFRQNGAWWIALDGGSYDVTVSIGDPAYASTHTINVNGVNFWDNYHLPKNSFATMTRTIHIHEGGGDIYIDQGLAANLATRINYVEITPAGDPPPPGTPVVTITTQNADGNNDNQAFEAGSDPAWFTIHRSGDTSEELTVYLTASGSADVSDFHQPIPQSWKISAGDSSSYFYLVPRDDNFAEPPEQLTLSISTNASYVRGTPASATVTVFDNDVPVPSDLILTVRSTAEINLDWADSVDPAIDSYNVYRGTSADFIPGFENLVALELEVSEFKDVELSAATNYYYKVIGVSTEGIELTTIGSGGMSTLTVDTAIPSAPINLTAESANDSEIILNWTDTSSNETQFVIQRSPDGVSGWTTVGSVESNAQGYTVRNLDDDTNYHFRVLSQNTAGSSTPTTATTQSTQSSDYDYYVILIGGHTERQSELDKGSSVGGIATLLRKNTQLHMNVHVYSEAGFNPGITFGGGGQALTDFTRAYNRGVRRWAIVGYSHGASLARQFADWIANSGDFVDLGNPVRLGFSGSIDGIIRIENDSWPTIPGPNAETQRPADSLYHYNIFQTNSLLHGDHVVGEDGAIENPIGDSGKKVGHTTIQHQNTVRSPMANRLVQKLQEMI